MKQALLLSFPLFLALFSCSQSIKYFVETPRTAQAGSDKSGTGIRQHDGKCFKNCIVPDHYESNWVTFPIYAGADPDAPVRIETLVVAPPQKTWVKKEKR